MTFSVELWDPSHSRGGRWHGDVHLQCLVHADRKPMVPSCKWQHSLGSQAWFSVWLCDEFLRREWTLSWGPWLHGINSHILPCWGEQRSGCVSLWWEGGLPEGGRCFFVSRGDCASAFLGSFVSEFVACFGHAGFPVFRGLNPGVVLALGDCPFPCPGVCS